MKTLDLFHEAASDVGSTTALVSVRLESAEDRARRIVSDIMKARHICVGAFSAGKDSSVLASVILLTGAELKTQGYEVPPIVIVHSQTGIENPVVARLALAELKKMELFAQRHQLDLRVLLGYPDLNDSFPVRVIGGRALPAFASSRPDCSTDLKVKVNTKLLNQLMRSAPNLGDWKAPVVMTGVRQNESAARDKRIEERQESAEGMWVNDQGHLRASPILLHTVDDVWEHLGMCAAGVYDSYSDFSDTMELYKAAGGSSCVIVADMKMSGSSKPCGARTGCWACTRIGPHDRSAEQMIDSDLVRYGFMKPLNRLRNWIANTQYDWSMRQFVGRSIASDGYIEIGADTYSPDTLKKLLVYTLTAERKSGVQIISIQQLFAIDARWSLYAIAPPFSALKIYLDLQNNDGWEEAPVVPVFPKTDVPKVGRIHVGDDWYKVTGIKSAVGLRDVGLEMYADSCNVGLKSLSNGALVCDYEEADAFSVDAVGAADFLEFLAEDYIASYCDPSCSDWTYGFKTYLRMGTISLATGQSRMTDEILRRSQWRQEHELHGQRAWLDLEHRCDQLHTAQIALL
ncbi:hypothetical protein [Comamonas testosteroni]|nr:hypothetical protein [Comamonas testosteroni]WKL18745.1 hypothetical protein QYQ99_27475 [Comamonas testosteroni]